MRVGIGSLVVALTLLLGGSCWGQSYMLTTIAGGYLGDGELATDASLARPVDVWIDLAGNIFIADEGNYRIRKVDAAKKTELRFLTDTILGCWAGTLLTSGTPSMRIPIISAAVSGAKRGYGR